MCLTVSAFLNSILLILRADIDTIYLRSESFKLIIDSKQLADAFFTSGNCIQTEKILIECTMLKRDERFLEAMFVRSCDQIIDKVM